MKTRNRIAILFCLAIAIPLALAAQDQKSPVTIRVTDVTGAVIVGAQVSIEPVPHPAPASMQTDQVGELRLELKPGKYTLEVRYHGFEKYTGHLDMPGSAIKSNGAPITIEMHVHCVVYDAPASFVGTLHLSLSPYHDDVDISSCEFPAFPHETITYHNEHTKSDEKYSGVALSELLSHYDVPLGEELRGKALSLYVAATGSDNYKAVLSLAEVDPAFHPGDIIVADVMDGKPLHAASGPFKLVVTEDKRPARSVRNLVSLELRSAD